jgi:hypothetical protein
MYAYLDERPRRASDMFAAVFRDEKIRRRESPKMSRW